MNLLNWSRWTAVFATAMLVAACGSTSAGNGGAGGSGGEPIDAPDALGSYAVGHTAFTGVDAARDDRELIVDVWYPVDEADAARIGCRAGEGAAYMVDDDDDEEVLVSDLGYTDVRHGLSPSSSSLLRHAAAYVVDDDEDIYTVGDDDDDDDGNLYYYHGNNAGLAPPTTAASSLWGDAPLFS